MCTASKNLKEEKPTTKFKSNTIFQVFLLVLLFLLLLPCRKVKTAKSFSTHTQTHIHIYDAWTRERKNMWGGAVNGEGGGKSEEHGRSDA